jgi:hypothetical protein
MNHRYYGNTRTLVISFLTPRAERVLAWLGLLTGTIFIWYFVVESPKENRHTPEMFSLDQRLKEELR